MTVLAATLLAAIGASSFPPGLPPEESKELSAFYAARAGGRAWTLETAREAIALLAAAPEHGLEAEDYGVAELERRWREAPSDALDALTSSAVLRYISDLHVGRVPPRSADVLIDSRAGAYDPVRLASDALSRGAVRSLDAAAAPRLPQYGRLRAALATYRALAAGPPLPEVTMAPAMVRPGSSFAGLPALAARLVAYGDLAAADRPAEGTIAYEGAVVEAVRSFQERHGLAVDGALGPATIAAIDAPPARWVRQIELSLERLRWVPDVEPGPLVVVDVPAFRLWGFDAARLDEGASLTMPVIVGKAVSRETPIFFGSMRTIVFRPYWNVPRGILRKDKLPEIRRDPGYVERMGMEIVRDFSAAPGDALPVTTETIEALAAGRAQLRQRPGPDNALGNVKFLFPNPHDVYLHDTPQRPLFERAKRDFSSGCVRVSDPAALAEFVLSGAPGWSRARVDAALEGPLNVWVSLPRPVPVLIFYTTVFADRAGRIHFTEDLYGLDAKLDAALASRSATSRARRRSSRARARRRGRRPSPSSRG